MLNAGGDCACSVVTHIQKSEAPELAEGCRQLGEAVVGKVEAAQPLESPHLWRQQAQAVVAQSEPLQVAQSANLSRDCLQVAGVHVEAGEMLQVADVMGQQVHLVPEAALTFWAHLQNLQLVQAKDLLRNRHQLSARDLEFLLPFMLWIVLCKVPLSGSGPLAAHPKEVAASIALPELWLVELRCSLMICCMFHVQPLRHLVDKSPLSAFLSTRHITNTHAEYLGCSDTSH